MDTHSELQKYIGSYFGITNENIDKVTSLFIKSELKKGEYFVKTGQYCEKLSFVQSGFIRVFASVKDKEITQWISSKGSFLNKLNFKVENKNSLVKVTTKLNSDIYIYISYICWRFVSPFNTRLQVY